MSRRPHAVCSCGAELRDPLPRACPACGEKIVGVRRVWWRTALSVLIALALFAACLVYLWWLAMTDPFAH